MCPTGAACLNFYPSCPSLAVLGSHCSQQCDWNPEIHSFQSTLILYQKSRVNCGTCPKVHNQWMVSLGRMNFAKIYWKLRAASCGYCCWVASVVSDSVRPHRRQPTRLPRPWNSPGKNSGVGCHFLLQCMKLKSESEVTQSCPTLIDPMDCSLPGSSVHGIFQARVLEWVAIAFSEPTANTQQMCCPYMFVTINALPYVLGKKIQAYGKKKKKNSSERRI